MKLSRYTFILLYFLFLPTHSIAQSSSTEKQGEAATLFMAIPFEGEMSETIDDIHSQFSQNPFGLPASSSQRMMDQFKKSFTVNTLLKDAREVFQQNYSPGYGSSTLQWLHSDTIQAIMEAQKEFFTMQGIRKRVINRYEMEQQPPSRKRLQLIESLSQNKGAVETEVESQVIIFRSLVQAFSELSPQRSFTDQEVERVVSNFQSQANQQIRQEVNNQLLLMYHGIPREALEQYLRFYDTEAGNWLKTVRAQSLHEAYRSAGEQFLNTIRNQ